MNIPTHWIRRATNATAINGRIFPVAAWGWGRDEASAIALAESRLRAATDRVVRGEAFPDGYEYARQPVREEILKSWDSGQSQTPEALLTRNRYGAVILNANSLLFLDIDLPPAKLTDRLFRLVGIKRGETEQDVLQRIQIALRQYQGATFRLYKTAAGFRAVAIDREYDPTSSDTSSLMSLVGADPQFAQLCKSQQCFRARLTPKPWRCNSLLPPGRYPRTDETLQQKFAQWLVRYDAQTNRFATCKYLETTGSGRIKQEFVKYIDLHDELTKATSDLPLA